MRLSIILLLPWLAVAAHGQITSEPSELTRRDDVPPISDFLRRAFASGMLWVKLDSW